MRERVENPASGSSGIRLIAGCAPCQPFSTFPAKNQVGLQIIDGHCYALFREEFWRLNRNLFTMENVPGLANQQVFHEFVKSLEATGYRVSSELIDCAAYGVPQERMRLVVLASKLGPLKLLRPARVELSATLRLGCDPPAA